MHRLPGLPGAAFLARVERAIAAEGRSAEEAGEADAVAPGGVLLVVGHDSENLTRGYGGPKDAARLFTPGDVVAQLGGLRIERAEQVQRPVETPDGERTAIDALVRAVRDAESS